jgi:C-terminal processing protease CtpA/Prc
MWENEEDNTLGSDATEQVLKAVKTAWLAGNPMTDKISFHGEQMLFPNGVHYTKPIVVLADEMSGSGGDAFPAMLQGMGRAKIVGTRTMGAGGHVVEAAPLSYSNNTVRVTKSLFFHPNGKPIENNGVTPDFQYTPTVNDFMHGYACYRQFYTQRLLDLVDPNPAIARTVAALGLTNPLGAAAVAVATNPDVVCP